MTSSLVTINASPALSFETLRNISHFVGKLNTKDAVEFLDEAGVPQKPTNPQETPTEIIYDTLKALALSSKAQDRELLEKIIIQSINPALYEKSGITVQGLIPKYNEWLKLDNLQITKSKDGNFILKSIDHELENLNADSDKEMDEVLVSNIKEPVLERITEIKYAYKLVMKIIDVYSKGNATKEAEINDFYIKLFKILGEDIEYVHAHIENFFGHEDGSAEYSDVVYGEQEPMSGNYIQPYIYQDEHRRDILYKPFLNLYSAPSEMERTGEDWDYITKRMSACYGVLEDRFHRFGADTIADYPHKNYIDKGASALNTEKLDDKGSLTLYLKSGRIVFSAPSGSTYKAQLRQGSNGYILLQYLMVQPVGIAVPYIELAKHLNKKNENIDSDEERRVRDAIQSVRKALKLKNNDDLFMTAYGFGLNCNSLIKSTE